MANKVYQFTVGVILLQGFIYALWMHFERANNIVEYSTVQNDNTLSNTNSKFKCPYWNCNLIDHENNRTMFSCWNESSIRLRRKWFYDGIKEFNDSNIKKFTINCSGFLNNVIPSNYLSNNAYDHVLINTYFFAPTLSIFINDIQINMNTYSAYRGQWQISSSNIKISTDEPNHIIKYHFSQYPNPQTLPDYHISFIGYNSISNTYSSGVWSTIPRVMDQYKCNNKALVNTKRKSFKDWEPCIDDIDTVNNECIIYSIGIEHEYDFDQYMGDNIGCTVYAFDCTVNYKKTELGTNIIFHPWCIIPDTNRNIHREKYRNIFDFKWEYELYSIIEIIKMFKHENKIIDIFKIDCEGCEYNVIHDLLHFEGGNGNYLTYHINQFYIEFHLNTNEFNRGYDVNMNKYSQTNLSIWFDYFNTNFYIFDLNINCGFNDLSLQQHITNGFLPNCCCYEYQFKNKNNLYISNYKNRLNQRKNAIVYLTQKSHASYRYNASQLFITSLDSLFKYYIWNINDETTDIIIFHSGDYDNNDLDFLLNRYKPFKNFLVYDLNHTNYWTVPAFLRNDNYKNWVWGGSKGYKVGYRHMIRWFSINLWDFAFKNNYNYILRMDDDSQFLSYINYNIFDYFKKNDFNYGFRIGEPPERGTYSIQPYITQYLSEYDYNLDKNIELAEQYYKYHKTDDNIKLYLFEDFRKNFMKNTFFFNNFFIGKVEFFMLEHVQHFLRFVDNLGVMYRKRLGDFNIQSAVVTMFSPPQLIHQFVDFSYGHIKNKTKCKQSISIGSNHYQNNKSDVERIKKTIKHCKQINKCNLNGAYAKYTHLDEIMLNHSLLTWDFCSGGHPL